MLTFVINSKKYLTPKEGIFFFFLHLMKNLKLHSLIPISSLKLPKKLPDYYQGFLLGLWESFSNTKSHLCLMVGDNKGFYT